MALAVRCQRIHGPHIQVSPHSATPDESKVGVVSSRKRKAVLTSKQCRHAFGFSGRTRLLRLRSLDLLKNLLVQGPIAVPAFDFGFRPLATSFLLDRSYTLPFSSREESRPESILEIVSQFAKLPKYMLAGTARSWLRNIGVTRHFRVDLLSCGFDLVLPIDLRVGSPDQSPKEVDISDPGLKPLISRNIDARHPQLDNEGRSEFTMSAFLASMPSWAHRVILKADPESLIDRLLPAEIIPTGARHIAACFWSFLCVIDDLTEDGDCFNCIETCIEALSTVTTLSGLSVKILGLNLPRDLSERSKLDDCKTIITAFHNAVSTTRLLANDGTAEVSVIEAWKVDFWLEVLSVIRALQAEKSLGPSFCMRDWIRLRLITISARPFMVLVRASLGLSATLNLGSPRINQMEVLVQAVMGLQNDLIGWQKDHKEGNHMNAVEVLIRQGCSREDAFIETLAAHNDLVRSLLCLSELDSTSAGDCPKNSWTMYLCTIISFCEAMAEWMLTSRRYRIEQIVVPGLMRLMYHDSNSMHNNIFRV